MKKVLLIAPLSEQYAGIRNYADPPLGVHRLSSFLKAHGQDVTVYDCNIHGSIDMERKWDIIGISILNDTLILSLEMFLRLEKEQPQALLVAGNSEATMNYSAIFENTNVNIVIIGEGEFPMLDLCNDKPLHEIKGIIYKNPAVPITDDLLWHYYKDIDFSKMGYHEYWNLDKDSKRNKTLRLVTSTHCRRNCDFCSLTMMHKFACGKSVKPAMLSGEQIQILIDRALQQIKGLKYCYFCEDSILPTSDRVDDFCKGISKYKGQLKFLVQTETDKVNYEIIKKLAENEVIHISFGVENCSENIRKSMGKKQNAEKIENIIEWCNKFNIRCYYLIILFYPSSTVEDLVINYKTLSRWIKSNKVTVSVEPYTMPYRGARLYNRDFEFEYKIQKLSNGNVVKHPYLVYPDDEEAKNIMLEFMYRQKDFLKEYIKDKGFKNYSKDLTGAGNIELLGVLLKEKGYL
jgi:radical SAM superfamily enzyme YgiQ (UPF0313 family)